MFALCTCVCACLCVVKHLYHILNNIYIAKIAREKSFNIHFRSHVTKTPPFVYQLSGFSYYLITNFIYVFTDSCCFAKREEKMRLFSRLEGGFLGFVNCLLSMVGLGLIIGLFA